MLKTIEVFASMLVLGFTLSYMMRVVSGEKIEIKRLIQLAIILFTLSYAASFIGKEIQLIISILSMIILGRVIYQLKWLRSLISSFLVYGIIIICDIVNGIFFNYILNIGSNEVMTTPSLFLLSSISVAFLSIFLVNLKNIRKSKDTTFPLIENFSKNQIFLIATYCSVVLALFVLLLAPYKILPEEYVKQINAYNLFVVLCYFLATILFLYINYHFFNEKLEHNRKIKEYEELKLYTEIIEKLGSDIRVFKHDYNNVMHSIEGYLNENKFDELKDYFYEEVMIDYKKVHSNNFMYSLKHINNSAVKGLLTSKINQALNLGLNINLEIFEDIHNFHMDILDLCKILGILLDNAIEASMDTEEGTVNIGLINDDSSISIIVSNSYSEKPNLNKIFEPGYSTKGNDRGLGLSSLKKIINEKYRNILLNTIVEDDLFIQEIIINKEPVHK